MFFLTFQMLFVSFQLENLTMTLFGVLLGNQWQSSMLEESISTSCFLNNLRALSSSSKLSINLGRPVLNIPIWSTDSYSSTAVPIKQSAPSVLRWLFWRCKVLTAFTHNLAWGQVLFIYVWQSGIKFALVFQSQSNYFILSFFSADADSDIFKNKFRLLKSSILITDYYQICSLCLLMKKKVYKFSSLVSMYDVKNFGSSIFWDFQALGSLE